MNSNIFFTSIVFSTSALMAQMPFPDAAGTSNTTAIHKDSAVFVNWANGHSSYVIGADVDATWQTPIQAYGKATGITSDIVCLGNSGAITVFFPFPIRDGAGADFAVFENAFSDTFLELAYVEVSSDGVNFFRFPTTSLTPSAVGAFGAVYPDEIDGFAGKYRAGFGTPFDLSLLAAHQLLDKENIRFVRLIDIIGDGRMKDSAGRSIFDPTPTIGSGGFDLDGIGVIHQNASPHMKIIEFGRKSPGFLLRWESNPGSSYRIETSEDLLTWQVIEIMQGAMGDRSEKVFPFTNDRQRFWRVVRP